MNKPREFIRRHISQICACKLQVNGDFTAFAQRYLLSAIEMPLVDVARMRRINIFSSIGDDGLLTGGTVLEPPLYTISVFQAKRKGFWQQYFSGWDNAAWTQAQIRNADGTNFGIWTAGAQTLDQPAGDTGAIFNLDWTADVVPPARSGTAAATFDLYRAAKTIQFENAGFVPPAVWNHDTAAPVVAQRAGAVTFFAAGRYGATSPGFAPILAEPMIRPQTDIMVLLANIGMPTLTPVGTVATINFNVCVTFDLEYFA